MRVKLIYVIEDCGDGSQVNRYFSSIEKAEQFIEDCENGDYYDIIPDGVQVDYFDLMPEKDGEIVLKPTPYGFDDGREV